MPRHQGRHPDDDRLFAAEALGPLRDASDDLSYLRTRGYADEGALKLVGDRHQLTARQRRAIRGAACSEAALAHRRAAALPPDQLAGRPLWIDGYNLLILLTTAQAGGPLLRGRAGALRDLAGLHSGYRPSEQTPALLALVHESVAPLAPAEVRWLLDQPISRSGQLAALIAQTAADHGWPWRAETTPDPDVTLRAAPSDVVIATGDGGILDHAQARWCDLAGFIIGRAVPDAWIVDWWG